MTSTPVWISCSDEQDIPGIDLTMAPPLKNHINSDLVEALALSFESQYGAFDAASFTRTASIGLDTLELKDRVNHIADAMAGHLPPKYTDALAIVVKVAKHENIQVARHGENEWAGWPLCAFVERHGTDNPEASLRAMPTLTKLSSCEFAVRPFLEKHLDLTLAHMRRWVCNEDATVRRLPSEGSRPLLPWGPRVPALRESPEIGIEIIAALRHDPSEVVRRSVANHLNDITKFQPDLVITVLRSWTTTHHPVSQQMMQHALRSLVKNGNPDALKLLGFTSDPKVSIAHFTCAPPHISIGSPIELTASFTSTSRHPQKLVVDFVIHHVTASGKTSAKVFKWTKINLAPAATVELKKHRKIALASTRNYHAGIHNVDLQISGHRVATTQFELSLDDLQDGRPPPA